MSATGRGSERQEHDFYPTPLWAIKPILRRLNPQGNILEPCAGHGAIIEAGQDPRRVWYAIDINKNVYYSLNKAFEKQHLEAFTIANFLEIDPFPSPFPKIFDWAITNPPYAQAETVIRKSLEYTSRSLQLLRLNFLEGQKRYPWLSKHVPDVYVLPRRPNFLKGKINKKTGKKCNGDACAYGWFLFTREEKTSGTLEILELDNVSL